MLKIKALLAKILTEIAGKLDKTGGTITGDLSVNQNGTFNQRADFTRGTAPSSSTAKGGYVLRDKNAVSVGRFDTYFYDDGYEGVRVGTARTVNGTSTGNYLIFSIDSQGNRKIGVNDSSVWRSALGMSNYNNTYTTTTTIADVIVANTTNATITGVSYAQYGKVAMVNISWKNKSAITVTAAGNVTDMEVGTLVSDKRPKMSSGVICTNGTEFMQAYSYTSGGVITLIACEATGTSRTIAAGTRFSFRLTYIL